MKAVLAVLVALVLALVVVGAVFALSFSAYVRGLERGYREGASSVVSPVLYAYPSPKGWPGAMYPVAAHAGKPPAIFMSGAGARRR